MSLWLIGWIALTLLGPMVLSLAVWWERKTDMEMDSWAAFLVVAAMPFSIVVGAIGVVGWPIFWMFG